jgi:hypothetical protein
MITFVVPESRSFGFRYFIEDRGGPLTDRFRILGSERLPGERRFAPGTYVFALDDLLPTERTAVGEVCDQLLRARPKIRLLNHPARTLGRFALLRVLHDAGRSHVRADRAGESVESLQFPVFVREELGHAGNLTPLLRTPRDVRRALARLALRGFGREELLVVEFCDTADPRGVFRKYSAYMVGDRVIPRCLEFGEHWMVKHNPLAYDADRIAEERDYVRDNPHEDALRETFALAGVQYGRADYAVLDGRLQVWEINLVPTIGRHRPLGEETADTLRVRALRRDTNDLFYSRFLAAWESLDSRTEPGEGVPVHVDERLWQAAVAERARWHRDQRHKRLVSWLTEQPVLSFVWRLLKKSLRSADRAGTRSRNRT